ncbi:MAG: hypothetical protein Q9186_001091 [Xanthomendoza sp. 1 TL-2023]
MSCILISPSTKEPGSPTSHVEIGTSLSKYIFPGERVAESSSAWLVDAAREYPRAQLDGFDLSTAQFPHTAWIPKNINLSTMDIFKPVSDDLRGQYDVVHVGLLVFVVEKGDPLPILDNLLALLKPGGYLQWDDADYGGSYVQSPDPSVPCAALQELKDKAHALLETKKGTDFRYVPNVSLDAGQIAMHAENANEHIKLVPDDLAHPWTMNHMMAAYEVINVLDQPKGSAADWWELYGKAVGETEQGVSMRMGMVSIIGRKASQGE